MNPLAMSPSGDHLDRTTGRPKQLNVNKADGVQACRNRLMLAGISTRSNELTVSDGTNITECVVSFENQKNKNKRQSRTQTNVNLQKSQNKLSKGIKSKSIGSMQSLFSPIQYQCSRKHKYTNEPIPNIPPPWTKLNPPKKRSAKQENAEEVEEGEIFETHKSTPSPILPILDDVVPSEYWKSKKLQEYVSNVKRTYLDAKSAKQKWRRLRDTFKNQNFQALVNDYLADCQMRRDRGEITDEECHVNSSMVLTLLFGQQISVEAEFLEAEQDLQICYEYLKTLSNDSKHQISTRAEPDEDVITYLNRRCRSRQTENHLYSGRDRNEAQRPSKVHCSDDSYDSDGVEHLKGYEDRLRISRALDQRAPFTRRHFNGKLTTFNEARATDRRGDSVLDPQLIHNANPVIQHSIINGENEQPSLLVGTEPIEFPPEESMNTNGSLTSLKGFIEQCINEDREYCQKFTRISVFANEELTKARCPSEKAFELRRHSLFGNYPSTGRKKFQDEEAMISDSDDDSVPFVLPKKRVKVGD